MVTFRITYKGANYNQMKALSKVFKKTVIGFIGLEGKELVFSFKDKEERMQVINQFKESLDKTSDKAYDKAYEIYETHAIVFLKPPTRAIKPQIMPQ